MTSPVQTSVHAAILSIVTVFIILACTAPALPADRNNDQKTGSGRIPQGMNAEFREGGETEEGNLFFEGAVTITWKNNIRFQADRVELRDGRYIEADGNILMVWNNNRVSGTRLVYDLQDERGMIENAIGELDPDYQIEAGTLEKIGEDVVVVRKAMVTTCTQPQPYWSFRVSRARVRLEGYARMWNVRLKARKAPVLYLPYLLWPVKEGRAAGLLLPEIHTTTDRGQAFSLPFFLPLGRSADLTLTSTYFTEAGYGTATDLRAVPNRSGKIEFDGFYIDDKVEDNERYRITYAQTQEFLNGFRMVADVNFVSDFDFFNDYERELRLTSSPAILTRVEMSRNGRRVSLNVREQSREQLFSDGSRLIQETLPEIEWRSRSQQLWETPLYLSYETSLASINQREKIERALEPGERLLDADYLRADLFPTLSAPINLVPWLEVTPRVSYRLTYYSQRKERIDNGAGGTEEIISDHSLTRGVGSAAIDLVGPKLYRIYNTPDSKFSKKYKHTLETTLSYTYGEDYDDTDDIIVYDEVDRYITSGNGMNYGLRSRLLAKRPRSGMSPSTGSGETIIMPGGKRSDPPMEGTREPEGDEEDQLETVEIATLEIRQSRSFERDLSFADLDGDGVNESSSKASDIQLVGRFNPSPRISLDVRSRYHTIYEELNDLTFAGSLYGHRGHVRFSLVHRNGLGVVQAGLEDDGSGNMVPVFEPKEDDTQFQFNAGMNLFSDKLRLDVNTSYDANPAEGQKRFGQKQWRIRYGTQCCTFTLERLARGFSEDQRRRDLYFRIDLRGVGKILDQYF